LPDGSEMPPLSGSHAGSREVAFCRATRSVEPAINKPAEQASSMRFICSSDSGAENNGADAVRQGRDEHVGIPTLTSRNHGRSVSIWPRVPGFTRVTV